MDKNSLSIRLWNGAANGENVLSCPFPLPMLSGVAKLSWFHFFLWYISNANKLCNYIFFLIWTHYLTYYGKKRQPRSQSWVRYPLEEIEYFIFSFPRFGNVVFRHYTQYVLNSKKSEERKCLNRNNVRTPGTQAPPAYPTMCWINLTLYTLTQNTLLSTFRLNK